MRHTTLNELFRRWLVEYAWQNGDMENYDTLMVEIRGKVRVGRKLSRDEVNERC